MRLLAIVLLLFGSLALAQPEQVTVSANAGYPTVSPAGDWVAFGSGSEIMKVPADGGTPVTLAAGFHPDWSPVGDLIAYDVGGDLYVVDATSAVSTPVASSTYFDRPAWSPDGNEIVCTGDPSVKIVSYPGGEVTVPPCSGECHGEDPDWSADGSTICFEDGVLIMTLPREGGVATTLVDCGNDVSYPAWSSDGRYVAFSRETPDYTANNIWVVDVATLELFQVTSGPYADYQPAWAPAGDWIYFKSNRGGSSDIWRVPFSEETPVESWSWGSVKEIFAD